MRLEKGLGRKVYRKLQKAKEQEEKVPHIAPKHIKAMNKQKFNPAPEREANIVVYEFEIKKKRQPAPKKMNRRKRREASRT